MAKCQISLADADNLVITREPVASNSSEIYPRSQIVSVEALKINSKSQFEDPSQWRYQYNTMVCVNIVLDNERTLQFDVQDVTNQAGWLPTLAGQKQCIADLLAWL